MNYLKLRDEFASHTYFEPICPQIISQAIAYSISDKNFHIFLLQRASQVRPSSTFSKFLKLTIEMKVLLKKILQMEKK